MAGWMGCGALLVLRTRPSATNENAGEQRERQWAK
jgi:hypothetical protein